MDLDTIVTIALLIVGVICCVARRYGEENVYLKYKEQKVGVRTKWWRK